MKIYIIATEASGDYLVSHLIKEYFSNKQEGLPGNDDTGTMSAGLLFSMMGIYPISPADPIYAVVIPSFDKITINLDNRYYKKNQLIIEKEGSGIIKELKINNKPHNSYFITHKELVDNENMKIILN